MTTKGQYAVTTMLYLAQLGTQREVSLVNISESNNISLSYLEKLFNKLRKQDLVSGKRGVTGGYKLARPPEEITLLEVLAAVKEDIDARHCKGKEHCRGSSHQCKVHNVWQELNQHVHGFLHSTTLTDALNKNFCHQEVITKQ